MSLRKKIRQLVNEANLLKKNGFSDQDTAKFISHIENNQGLLAEDARRDLQLIKLAESFLTSPRDNWGLITERLIIELTRIENALNESESDSGHEKNDNDPIGSGNHQDTASDENDDPFVNILTSIISPFKEPKKTSKADKLKAGAKTATGTAKRKADQVINRTKETYAKYAPEAKKIASENGKLVTDSAKQFARKFKETNFPKKDK